MSKPQTKEASPATARSALADAHAGPYHEQDHGTSAAGARSDQTLDVGGQGRGASVSAIQRLLGHSTLAMTERYVHVDESSLRDAIALLGPRDLHVSVTPRATPSLLVPKSIVNAA